MLEEVKESGAVTSYTIGDDVLSQTIQVSGLIPRPSVPPLTSYLLADGHGSTRQLTDSTGAVTAQYSYDSYGLMLGSQFGNQQEQATKLLYCGEAFDASLQQYYLRARHYDPSNGRFNRLDPFGGLLVDPPSLHKYAYCHSDPVNAIDPSGEFTLLELMIAVAIIVTIATLLVVFVGPPIMKFMKFLRYLAVSKPIGSSDLERAARQMKSSFWQDEPKMKALAGGLWDDFLGISAGRWNVMIVPESAGGGFHFKPFDNYLFVSQKAVTDGDLATALVIFGEYQHTNEGGNLSDETAPAEFGRIRGKIPPEKATDYIKSLHHGD